MTHEYINLAQLKKVYWKFETCIAFQKKIYLLINNVKICESLKINIFNFFIHG